MFAVKGTGVKKDILLQFLEDTLDHVQYGQRSLAGFVLKST